MLALKRKVQMRCLVLGCLHFVHVCQPPTSCSFLKSCLEVARILAGVICAVQEGRAMSRLVMNK